MTQIKTIKPERKRKTGKYLKSPSFRAASDITSVPVLNEQLCFDPGINRNNDQYSTATVTLLHM